MHTHIHTLGLGLGLELELGLGLWLYIRTDVTDTSRSGVIVLSVTSVLKIQILGSQSQQKIVAFRSINDVLGGKMHDILREFLGHNFVSGLCTLKSKKNCKINIKKFRKSKNPKT